MGPRNKGIEMKSRKTIVILVALAAMTAAAASVPQPAFQMKEGELLDVLGSSTNLNDRVTACQELGHTGSDAAVPALAALLVDDSPPALFHAARYGLQNIPGAQAEAALRAAESRSSGKRREALAASLRLRNAPVPAGYDSAPPPAPAQTALQKGDPSLLPALFDAAVLKDVSARRALVGFPSAAADRFLAERLSGSDKSCFRMAVGIMADRRSPGTFADFVRRAESESDDFRRSEYFKALDALSGAAEVPVLLSLLKKFPADERLAGTIIRVCSREMIPEKGDVEIISAEYGNFATNMVKDVKEMITSLVAAGSRRIAVGSRLAGAGGFAKDPAPGFSKELRVEYRFGGFRRFAAVPEAGELVLVESVLAKSVADALYAACAGASGQEAEAFDRIFAALSRRGVVPGAPESAFKPIFDGKSLDGWSQQDGYWSVRDGVITGDSTAERPCKPNHHLVYTAREFSDFELRARFRLSKGANSGIQLRCKPQFVGDNGYQADMNGGGNYVGFLYHPRQHLVGERGADVSIAPDGTKSVVRFADGKELQKLYKVEQWNDMRVVVRGRRIDVWVNGVRTTSVEDAREEFLPAKGHIAVQLHQGPPMKVEFRDLRIKE